MMPFTRQPPVTLLITLLCLGLSLAGCSGGQPRFDPLPHGATVLAFGDSVTYGTGAGSGEDYPSLLAQHSGWRVINAGIPGDTAARGKSRIDALLREFRPELVLVSLGGNDFLRQRRAAEVKADLREIVAAVRSTGGIPVLIAVPEVSALRASLGTLADAPLYRELADEEDLLLIDGVFSRVLSRGEWRTDPIHPNAEGYRQFAAGVFSALENAGLYRSDP